MKIPKRVNGTLDWMGHHVRVVAVVGAALIISIVMWSWVPPLSAFVLGVAIGGTIVHLRMASRQATLRSDIDDLLRQNGALRREKLTLASGVIAKQTQLTAKLPVIPDDSPAGDTAGQPAARTDPTAPGGLDVPAGPVDPADPVDPEAHPATRIDPKAPDPQAPVNPVNPVTRTKPDADAVAKAESPASRTTKLPVVTDDSGTA